MSNETSKKPPELEYERPAGITRRAFRLLLLLTFINTILLGANLMGPQTWASIRGAFVNWKNDRAKAAAIAKTREAQAAIREKARVFRFPEGHVAYTEVPEEALRYVSQGLGYNPLVVNNGEPPPRWQAPVLARPSGPLRAGKGLSSDGQLFVHERKSPDGKVALVVVVIAATYEFKNSSTARNNSQADEISYHLSKRRELQAVALVPGEDGDLKSIQRYTLRLILPDTESTEVARMLRMRDAPPTTQIIPMMPGNQLRLFGGSPDPADASHFTIPYELDGQPGVIDGWLGNDSLVLRPRQGRSIESAREPTWELLPTTNPTTPPAAAPAAPR